MQLWDVLATEATGKTDPRVLFSTPEARMVMIDLAAGEERSAITPCTSGRSSTSRAAASSSRAHRGTTACAQGSVILLEPGERHAVRAGEAARILLTLAPWPGRGHYDPSDAGSSPPGACDPHSTA